MAELAVRDACDALASMVSYPDDGYAGRVATGLTVMARACPPGADRLSPYTDWVARASTAEMQELYAQTFDFDPACTLDVGWHLYGENYDRGEFLVRLRRAMRESGVTESTELPDHLSHMLALLGRVDAGQARAYVSDALLPALSKVRTALDGKNNPFDPLLDAIQIVLRDVAGVTSEGGATP